MSTSRGRQHTPSIFDKVVAPHAGQSGGQGRNALADMYGLMPDITSEPALKRAIGRDLGWLLNTISLESTLPLDDYPQVQKSVLNYGLRDLSGHVVTKETVARTINQIRKAIATFEPRLDRNSLNIDTPKSDDKSAAPSLAIDIRGEIAPSRLFSLYYTADLDLDSGAVSVRG